MRIAIVNDLPMAVEHLRREISAQPGLSVLWTASDGAQAVLRCAEQRPDLVLMDIFMPVMNGAQATRQIMAYSPCPVLVVTADVGIATREAFAALNHGALDVVAMPRPRALDGGHSLAQLLGKIEQLRRLIDGGRGDTVPDAAPDQRLILIGGSSGAPGVLLEVLRGLPRPLAWPVVISQHIAPEFAPAMAAWLDSATGHRTVIAQPSSRIQSATVHLAGLDGHLVMERAGMLAYSPTPRDHAYRPSINRLFSTAAQNTRPGVAVLLSGMGADGAQGLLELRNRGWHTLVQEPSSCEVASMPNAALSLKAAIRTASAATLAAVLQVHIAEKESTHATRH